MTTRNAKDFFDSYLSSELGKNPGVIADAGLRSQAVSVDIDGAGAWTLAFDASGKASLEKGANSKDCTISMNEKTWDGLIGGTLNVPMAVITRKIKIKGDTGLAAKLGMALRKAGKG